MTQLNVKDAAERQRDNIGRVVIGQTDAVDLIMISILCEGHILLEGVPGVAKTLLAQTFASSLDMKFGRIQFTPDLMPGDVLGTNIYQFETGQFKLTKGPVFTDLLLADEVNRTPPKTQAALLQAMHEKAVTIDGTTYDLGNCFSVIATQNPIEQQGTYPLPEAQLDRFLFHCVMDYPSRAQERSILLLHGHRGAGSVHGSVEVSAILTMDDILTLRKEVAEVTMSEELLDYLLDIVRATREHPSIRVGASPRCGAMMARASRAVAAMEGRDYVIPDDIKRIALPALRHRLVLAPAAEIEGTRASDVVGQIIEQVKAPR